VKKLIIFGAGSVMAVSAALFGAGVAAAAPDVVGDTYSDAVEAINRSGGDAVVASRVGDKLEQDDCIVTNAWDASFLRIDSTASGDVQLALNCNGAFASATNPGTSVQHPLGRAAKSEAEQEAAEQEEQELAEAATPDE
jgi:hypothetical protein